MTPRKENPQPAEDLERVPLFECNDVHVRGRDGARGWAYTTIMLPMKQDEGRNEDVWFTHWRAQITVESKDGGNCLPFKDEKGEPYYLKAKLEK